MQGPHGYQHGYGQPPPKPGMTGGQIAAVVAAICLFGGCATCTVVGAVMNKRAPATPKPGLASAAPPTATPAAPTQTPDQVRRQTRRAELMTSVTSNPGPLGKPVSVAVTVTNRTQAALDGFSFTVRVESDQLEPTRILGGTSEGSFMRLHRFKCKQPAEIGQSARCEVWLTPKRFGTHEVRVKMDDLYDAAGVPLEETVSVPVR